MVAIGFTMASMLDTHCVGCYRHEHFALNQLVKFFHMSCCMASGTHLRACIQGGMFSLMMMWYFPGSAPDPSKHLENPQVEQRRENQPLTPGHRSYAG